MPKTSTKAKVARGGPLIPDPAKGEVAEMHLSPVRAGHDEPGSKCVNGCDDRARMLVNDKPYCAFCLKKCWGVDLGTGTDVAGVSPCG